MVVPPALLTWSDLSLVHSSQDPRKVLFVTCSASAFGSFEHVLWQYLPQLSHDKGVVFHAIARLHCRHLATSERYIVL